MKKEARKEAVEYDTLMMFESVKTKEDLESLKEIIEHYIETFELELTEKVERKRLIFCDKMLDEIENKLQGK